MTLAEKHIALSWALQHHRNTRMERMDFRNSAYLLGLYLQAGEMSKMVVEKCVQSGISELLIILAHMEAAQGLRVMYVLPAYEMRDRFVSNRISRLHTDVDFYRRLVAERRGVHRKSLMVIGQGSIAFVGSNVESEFIEMPVDSAYVDELDRCNQENLLKIPDRLSASPYKHLRQVSNPTVDGFGIDALYLESSQGRWTLKCPNCGEWFGPDFFKHVVVEAERNRFEVRDTAAADGEDIRLIHDCGTPVDRLSDGEWVHFFPSRETKGFRISKLIVKHTSLRQLAEKWDKAKESEIRRRVFFNSDLGLPYLQEGSRITSEILRRCERHLPQSSISDGARFVGVDVGAEMHIVCRQVSVLEGREAVQLVEAQRVGTFSELIGCLEKMKPTVVVIDSQPEIHKVRELKGIYQRLYSASFKQGLEKLAINNAERSVSVDRTAALDAVKNAFEERKLVLPLGAEGLDGGEYFKQLQASTRILEWEGDDRGKSRFTWVNGKPNHYFLAEAYCLLAFEISRGSGVLDFFGHDSEPMRAAMRGEYLSDKDVDRLSMIQPGAVLGKTSAWKRAYLTKERRKHVGNDRKTCACDGGNGKVRGNADCAWSTES